MIGTSRPDWGGSWQCRKNGGGMGNCVGEKLVETQCVIWYNMRSANGKRCKAAGCACYATAKTGFTGFTAALRQFYGYATGAKPDGAPYLHGGRLLMGNISYRFSDMEYIVFSARHDAAGVGWGKEDT